MTEENWLLPTLLVFVAAVYVFLIFPPSVPVQDNGVWVLWSPAGMAAAPPAHWWGSPFGADKWVALVALAGPGQCDGL